MIVTAFLRTSGARQGKSSVYFRLRDTTCGIDIKTSSKLKINPVHWSDVKQGYKNRILQVDKDEQVLFDHTIQLIKDKVQEEYSPKLATKEWLDRIIMSCFMGGETYVPGTTEVKEERKTIEEWIDFFIESENPSNDEVRHLRVIQRWLHRYVTYQKLSHKRVGSYQMYVETLMSNDLESLREYFINEYKYIEMYPQLLDLIPERRMPQKRSGNTAIANFKRLRKIIYWCEKRGIKTNNPFRNFVIGEEKFGTPYYLTIEERNTIYNTDMSSKPALEIQRDIFVFHCLIGCRVSDLVKLTKANIIDGAVEYIATKTKNECPTTIRVPLSSQAKEIMEKYKDLDCQGKLLPMISVQRYNDAIKEVLTVCGITRPVVVLNPVTREEEIKPLNEIASSHIARRTFAGNLYKKVKDPNLVCALTGHKEGSKAFSRYRAIDEEMKIELVNLLQ